MKITLLSEERIRLEDAAGPLTIMAESAEMNYSPFHMLASALGTCLFSVLHSWATHAQLAADRLAIEVGWTFADHPRRVGAFDVTIDWPGLPEGRRAAAERAATLCAIHGTFTHPPQISVEVA